MGLHGRGPGGQPQLGAARALGLQGVGKKFFGIPIRPSPELSLRTF